MDFKVRERWEQHGLRFIRTSCFHTFVTRCRSHRAPLFEHGLKFLERTFVVVPRDWSARGLEKLTGKTVSPERKPQILYKRVVEASLRR